MTDERLALLRNEVARIATEVRGDDFWINGRPFILQVGPENAEQLPEIAESGLSGILGWSPQEIVTFAAMCNGDQDHHILAQLCIAVAERDGGVIDFGGCLAIGPTFDGSVRSGALRVENPEGTKGVLFATAYETGAGSFATTHCGDVALVRSWLQHPDFRMLK